MRDVVVDEIIYIDEEIYQQLKKDICKKDDYFSVEEIKILKNENSNAIIISIVYERLL